MHLFKTVLPILTIGLFAMGAGAEPRGGVGKPIAEPDDAPHMKIVDTYTVAHKHQSIQLPTDRVAMLEIVSNASTGYRWEVLTIDPSIRVLDSEYVQTIQGIGAPGVQRFYFGGAAAGEARVQLVYKRQNDVTSIASEVFSIQSQGAFTGTFALPKKVIVTPKYNLDTPGHRQLQPGAGVLED